MLAFLDELVLSGRTGQAALRLSANLRSEARAVASNQSGGEHLDRWVKRHKHTGSVPDARVKP